MLEEMDGKIMDSIKASDKIKMSAVVSLLHPQIFIDNDNKITIPVAVQFHHENIAQ
jgi:hypothetical protein